MNEEARLSIIRLHYDAWAKTAGFQSLEDALKAGTKSHHCGLITIEGGIIFRSGIILSLLEALVAGEIETIEPVLDNLPVAWKDSDGLNDGTYATFGVDITDNITSAITWLINQA